MTPASGCSLRPACCARVPSVRAHTHKQETAAMSCNQSGLIIAAQLPVPLYQCTDFHTPSACSTHVVPSGSCEWSSTPAAAQCASRRQCRTLPPTGPSGTSFMFFKFHKVGGSTVSRTLQSAMSLVVGSPYVSCLEHSETGNKTVEARARYRFCRMCTHHDSTLPLIPTFKLPAVLSASREARLAAMFATPTGAAAMDQFCPMQPSIQNTLFTGTMIRRPVDRVISKYFFLRTYVSRAHESTSQVRRFSRPFRHVSRAACLPPRSVRKWRRGKRA